MSNKRRLNVPPQVPGRVAELGDIGLMLAHELSKHFDIVEVVGYSQNSLRRLLGSGLGRLGMASVALSVLHLSMPMQVKLTDDVVVRLAGVGAAEYVAKKSKLAPKTIDLDDPDDRKTFPLKVDKQATTKVNVFFRDVWQDIVRFFPVQAEQIRSVKCILKGMYNDHASASVMHMSLLGKASGVPVVGYARAATDPEFAKSLSVVLKACGAGQRRLACMLCEGQTLVGRGVGDLDLEAEIVERTQDGCGGKVVDLDEFELRRAVREVLSEELDVDEDNIEYCTTDEYFDKRWLNTVNGSHNKSVHGKYGIPELPPELAGMQLHRRVGVEVMTDNPLPMWDGEVVVSASVKLEPGKRRALFACDTVSYMAFDYLLSPIEKVWRGKRVLLDPGKGGSVGMARRLDGREKDYSHNVMLDYEAFNEHHSLMAQKVVIEEAGRRCTDGILEKCVSSFDKMYIRGDKNLKVKGTLMSGHRATSFINSVLNAVYIKLMLGTRWHTTRSVHVGDDVVVMCESAAEACGLIDAARESVFRFNDVKQSYGRYAKEFLRMAGKSGKYYGYLARSISGTVAGSWVNDIGVGVSEAIPMYNQMAWALVNRSGVQEAGMLLYSTMLRRCELSRRTVTGILKGTVSVNNGPVRAGLVKYTVVRVRPVDLGRDGGSSMGGLRRYPRNATNSYLAKCTSKIEIAAIRWAGADIGRMMQDASYVRSLQSSHRDPPKAKVSASGYWRPGKDEFDAVELATLRRDANPLGKHPLVQLVSNGLNRAEVRELCRLAGYAGTESEIDAVFGEGRNPKACRDLVPYGDASAACAKATQDVLSSTITVAM